MKIQSQKDRNGAAGEEGTAFAPSLHQLHAVRCF